LARLPKLILPAQTTASTANTSTPESRCRSRERGKKVALPQVDSHVPGEEVEKVMESLGVICYYVVGIYSCVFVSWVVHVFRNPALAVGVGAALWGIVQILLVVFHWSVGG